MTMIEGGRRVDGLGVEHNPEPIRVALDRARNWAVMLEGENAAMRERMDAVLAILRPRCYCDGLVEFGATGEDECLFCRAAALLDPSMEQPHVVDALFDRLPIADA